MKKSKWLIIALVIALVLTACGNGEEGEVPEEATEETVEETVEETAEGTEDLSPLTIVLDFIPNTNHTGIYVAQKNGYFTDHGLDVNIIQPPDEGAPLLVASGGAEIGIDFQDLLGNSFTAENPLPITVVGTIIQHNTSGIVSLAGNGMDRPKGMEGKTYASWDSPIEHAIIRHVVEKDGGDFEKIDIVPFSVDDALSAIQTNIDAVWIYYAWDGIAAEVNDIDIDYFDFASIDSALDFYSPVFIANNEFLENEPEKAKAVMAALKEGYEFAIENPEEAADILLEYAPELDRDLVVESQIWLADEYKAEVERWGYIDSDRWNTFYDWLYANDLIEKEIPNDFGFTNEFLPE